MENPLDEVGAQFALSLMNPNPSSGRNKAGPWYRVSFEIDEDAYAQFQRARELGGMVIEGVMQVAALNEPLPRAQPVDAIGSQADSGAGRNPGDDESESRAVTRTALSHQLHESGYFRNAKLWQALADADLYSMDAHVQYIRSLNCLFATPRRGPRKLIKTAWNLKCSGEVCGHHTPSASLPAGGTDAEHPNKVPDWFQVPLCHNHHANWAHGSHASSPTRQEKKHLVSIGVRLMAEQAETVMKGWLGIESLNDLTEASLAAWNAAINFNE